MVILDKLKTLVAPLTTDDQYREKIAGNATTILNNLLDSLPVCFHQQTSLNVLVIGAGFFPSYTPMIQVLTQRLLNLTDLNFTLIEPLKSDIERFNNYFTNLNQIDINNKLKVSCSSYNIDIKQYLSSGQNVHFDIIYYEHPDLSPIGSIFTDTSNIHEGLNQLLRESIPYLKNIIHPESIIIASCLFHRDLKLLNNLINYSLNIPTRLVYLPGMFMDGSPYNSG